MCCVLRRAPLSAYMLILISDKFSEPKKHGTLLTYKHAIGEECGFRCSVEEMTI